MIDALVASYASFFGEVEKSTGELAWKVFMRNLIESQMAGMETAHADKFSGLSRVMARHIMEESTSDTDMAMQQCVNEDCECLHRFVSSMSQELVRVNLAA